MNDLHVFCVLMSILILVPPAVIVIGRIGNRYRARIIAWSWVVGVVFGVECLSRAEPAGTRMVLIMIALLWGMKGVVLVESRIKTGLGLRWKNGLAFTLGWPGMRPCLFRRILFVPCEDWKVYFNTGLVRLGLGGMLISTASLIWSQSNGLPSRGERWIGTLVLLTGISLVVHFGVFRCLVGYWRWMGVKCTLLFRAPLNSKSLGEFWGRRWNLAFSEMTAIAVFRPLKNALAMFPRANGMATGVAFGFSGLLHELAISVPVSAGYGLPTLYFAIQGLGVMIEEPVQQMRVRSRFEWAGGRVWVAAWVLLPLPILFHRPFLVGCVWPLIGG